MIKKRISLVLFLCVLVPVAIFGCNSYSPSHESTPGPEETTEAVLPSSVDVIAEGVPQIRVVRGDGASRAEIDAAMAIRKAIADMCAGAAPEIIDDFDVADPSVPEIIVGRTKYPDTVNTLNSLNYGEYTIRITGKKIIVAAWTDFAIGDLAERFIAILGEKLSADRMSLTLTDADNFAGVYNRSLNNLPSFDDAFPAAITYSGDHAYQVVITKSTEEAYRNYLGKLEVCGYTKHSERTAAGNLFAIYNDDSNAINVYYTPFNKTVRIITEPLENLFVGDDGSYTALTSPKLIMIGRRFSNTSMYLGVDSGAGLMCFVIQLSDGRFIVIDGGVATDAFAQAIYASLLNNAPDKDKIIIAAWIMTHSHGDHTGGFCRFAELYSSKVTLERIIYNFPSEADAKSVESGNETLIRRVSGTISAYYRNSAVNKAHTGQVYNIADAEIEVIYNVEDYVNARRTFTSTKIYNLSSMIFSVSIAGQKIMFLGDSQVDSNNQTATMYGSYLKSDIVQVAHHGGEGGTTSIYKVIDPDIALFTTTDALLPLYLEFTYNDYLVNKLHVKEYYNAADRIYTWVLPYRPTGSGWVK